MEDMLLNAAYLLATSIGGWLLSKLARLLDAYTTTWATKSKLGFLANLDEVVMGFVVELYEAEVKHLKAAKADGKLDSAERKRFLTLIVNKAKDYFGFDQLSKVFGPAMVETALESRIELAVQEAKK